MRAANATIQDLRAARDRARKEYLAAARTHFRDTAECGRRWREFLETNAAYLRTKGQKR
jgi:hypothetical protein